MSHPYGGRSHYSVVIVAVRRSIEEFLHYLTDDFLLIVACLCTLFSHQLFDLHTEFVIHQSHHAFIVRELLKNSFHLRRMVACSLLGLLLRHEFSCRTVAASSLCGNDALFQIFYSVSGIAVQCCQSNLEWHRAILNHRSNPVGCSGNL